MSEEILVRLADIEKRLAVLERDKMAKFLFAPEETQMIKKRNKVKKNRIEDPKLKNDSNGQSQSKLA